MNNKILIVDDDEYASSFVAKLLNAEGYETAQARNGNIALEMLDKEEYAVVLLDLKMPVLNGTYTFDGILAKPLRPVVYIFTGDIKEEEIKYFKDRGVEGIIYKPFNLSEVRKKIKKGLAAYKKRSALAKKKNILIVDDDYFVRKTLKKMLSDTGYVLTTATNGRAAVKKVLNSKFDLILLDIKMQEMDGLETLKVIREKKINTPIILISGYLTFECIEEATKFSIFSYVRKPFNMNDLRRKIERALEQK